MDKIKRTCPVCIQNGKESKLELKQINLTEAVYICEDRTCIYPIGFQWEYVKNNILEDSDSSSDEEDFDLAISLSDKSNTNNKQTYDYEDQQKKINPINIINNIKIEGPEDVLSKINKKDYVKTNDNILKCNENIRKSAGNNKINKNKTQNCLPESVVKNAKELSKYFSSQDQQPEKPTTSIKTAFDILKQPVKKENESKAKTKNVASSIKNVASNNKNKVNSDNKNISVDDVINDEQEKINIDLPATFDDLLFENDENCDENQTLDVSDMDELLAFL